MWLRDRVALVGSGDIGGMGLTDPFDCHLYLLDGGSEAALIDAGSGFDIDAILRQIEASGIDRARLRYLLLTHAHFDHAGGAAELAEQLHLHVIAGAETAQRLHNADEEATGLQQARALGLYPAHALLHPCNVDTVVADGDTIQIGDTRLTALHTPGHSGDHISYLADTNAGATLFAGDAVFAGGRIALQVLPDCRLADCFATIRKLAALNVDSLLSGHGLPILQRGATHLQKALASVDAMQIPPAMYF